MTIAAFIIFVVLYQCSPTRPSFQETLCQTIPPATVGLPPDWQIWPHSPSESDEPDYTIQQALYNLIIVLEAFEPDRAPARVNEPFNVTATIQTYLRKQEVGLVKETPIYWALEKLTISDRLAATLVDARRRPTWRQRRAFVVSPTDQQEQGISNCKPTSWTWQVIPKVAGNDRVLRLNFYATIILNGVPQKLTVDRYYEEHLHVYPKRKEPVGEWFDLIRKTLRTFLPT